MAKEYAVSFYKSKAWTNCRNAYFNIRYGLCERCGAGGKIVHHKIEITPSNINDPGIALGFNNLELLCQACHNNEHMGSKELLIRDGLVFDEKGNVVEVGEEH